MHEATRGPSTRGTRTPGRVGRRTSRALAGIIVAVIAAACEGSVEPEPPRAASIAVSPVSARLVFLGDTAVFVAVVRDQYGAEFSASPSWSSSDPTVFTISGAGVATAVGNGAGVVTASLLDLSATAAVEVAQQAASVEVVSGGDQSARQGRALGDSIVVRVVDAGGAGVSGVRVSFAPAEGDGSVAPGSATSDSAGLAATAWTLGDYPGEQRLAVAVTAPGGPSVDISATALTPEETVASLEVASGGEQRVRRGRALGDSIVVRATDAEGEVVEGAVIVFAPAEGNGSTSPDSVTSDSAGLAATLWTLGDPLGEQRLAASAATVGSPTVEVSATALTPEETVASLAVVAGDEQRGRRARALGDSIVVRATDAEGEVVEGAVIVFAPADGNGTVAPDSVTSDSAGLAATAWTLGDELGAQQLAASVATAGGPTVDISATAVTPEEAVASLEVASGGEQRGRRGRALGDSIVVRATDAEGEAVKGAVIVFVPPEGNGTVAPDSVVSDSAGLAATAWTLGDRLGQQRLTASAATPGGPTVDVSATAVTPEEAVASLEVLSGSGQQAVQGSTLGDSIVVKATDAEGEAVEGAVIVFAPADGHGVAYPDSAATDPTGTARTAWTLGDRPGDQNLVVTVAVAGGPSVQATATATRRDNRPPEVAESLPLHILTAGGRQLRLDGSDHFYDVDGDPISYSAASSQPAVVDVSVGSFGVITLTTGSPGITDIALVATDPSGAVGHLYFSAIVLQVPGSATFDIDLVWLSPGSRRQNQALRSAAARWQQVVTADIPNVQFSGQEYNWCGLQFRIYAELDDLAVFTVIRNIDGAGGTLGLAGPCVVRSEGLLPMFATVVFDSSDLDRFDDVGLSDLALHELGHTLGIGTLWGNFGLLQDPSVPDNAGADTHFTGPSAVAAFNDAGGLGHSGGKVPVENKGVQGSSDSHWRDSVFGNELMNPYYQSEKSPLSAITIQSLADMGYAVDVAQADPYTLPAFGLREKGVPPTGAVSYGADAYRGPLAVVGRNGRLVRVLQR